jgi:hypothetical protein
MTEHGKVRHPSEVALIARDDYHVVSEGRRGNPEIVTADEQPTLLEVAIDLTVSP